MDTTNSIMVVFPKAQTVNNVGTRHNGLLFILYEGKVNLPSLKSTMCCRCCFLKEIISEFRGKNNQ